MTPQRHRSLPPPDMEATKEHIMAAGKEILLAAQGALSFCKGYVESSAPEGSRSNLLGFFQKALAVADELGRGLVSATSIKKTAAGIAKPLLAAMDQEMKAGEEAPAPRKPPRRKAPAAKLRKSAPKRHR